MLSAAALNGPGNHPIAVTVSESCGKNTIAGTTVTILNAPPSVGLISAPLDPQQITASVNASAAFTDPGIMDTHTATWNWGDGTTSPGTVTETGGSGAVTGSYVFAKPGVYRLVLTVADKDGASAQSPAFEYAVIYDPGAGFVTGAGWILSPPGAYPSNPPLSGKATLGFVSRYQSGASVPTGETQFRFHVTDLGFKTTSYQRLAVAAARAQCKCKGEGSINGSGSYGFLSTAIDGQQSRVGGVDRFRIKIRDKVSGAIVYDNQLGADDNSNTSAELTGGSIVIHK